MKILYIHGFGSKFDENSNKVRELSTLGSIYGIDIDWTKNVQQNIQILKDIVIKNEIDIIIGTSLGGWAANHLGVALSIPFVAINPAINPKETLKRYIGKHKNYNEEAYILTKEIVDSYEKFKTGGYGLILLDMGDEVIDAKETINTYDKNYMIEAFMGGTHRFNHMKESIEIIKRFYNQSICSYGIDNI